MHNIFTVLAPSLVVAAIISAATSVLVLSFLIGGWPFLGITFVLILALFLYQGMREIPALPPHVALVTFFGKRIERVVREGWHFFPLQPFLVGFIPIRVERVNQDLDPEIFKTPDLANLKIRVALTWTPDWEEPKNLVAFVTNGGEEGVKRILDDVVPERIREWLTSTVEGPLAFREAMTAQEEAVETLLKTIAGAALKPEIPGPIPSGVLFKLLFWEGGNLPENVKEKWTQKWNTLPQEEKDAIMRAMEARRAIVKRFRDGSQAMSVPHLGITLNRLNFSAIVPEGPIVKAAEKIEIEKEEAAAETVEAEFLAKRASILSKDLGISTSDAIAALQVERGKATKEIREHRLDLSPSAADMLKKIVSAMGKAPPSQQSSSPEDPQTPQDAKGGKS